MEKELYYSSVLTRKNVLWEKILDFFLAIASYPRLLLEVFIRKNFGIRYLNYASAFTALIVFALLPTLADSFSELFYQTKYFRRSPQEGFWLRYATWYGFLAVYAYFAHKRLGEMKHKPSVFDFAKVSTYSGDIDYRLWTLGNRNWNLRQIEIFVEPSLFAILGFILYFILGQNLGMLLLIVSGIYSLSYVAAYHKGDNFVMDMIDKMINNEHKGNSFMDDKEEGHKGVRNYARKPVDPNLRRKVATVFTPNDEHKASYPNSSTV